MNVLFSVIRQISSTSMYTVFKIMDVANKSNPTVVKFHVKQFSHNSDCVNMAFYRILLCTSFYINTAYLDQAA